MTAPNLFGQYFEAERQNSIWMADIPYIRTGEGLLYLAAVMDLCSRKISTGGPERGKTRNGYT